MQISLFTLQGTTVLYPIRTIYKQIQRVTVIQQKFAHHYMQDL